MDTTTTDRLIIGLMCVVGLCGMIVLALSDHVEAAVSLPAAVAGLAAILRNNQRVNQVADAVADVKSNVSDLSNGELTDRIRAGFVQAMQDTGHAVIDAEPAGPLDTQGRPYRRRQDDASTQPIR